MKVYTRERGDGGLISQGWRLRNTAVALGGFDAIHIGHQAIVKKVVEYAKTHRLTSVVYLFRNQPRGLLEGGAAPDINPFDRRLELLEALGVEIVAADWFTPELSAVSAEGFAERYLKDWLGAAYLAAGFNYRFGSQGSGDIGLLQKLGARAGITVESVPCVSADGAPVSSSRIRERIALGDMEDAAACLGRPFSVRGRVEPGNRLGRTLGFPTANLELPQDCAAPGYGVYISRTRAGDRWYPSITNVGEKPTVEQNRPCIESHLIGYAGDLYGSRIEIAFYRKIRGITRFADTDALRARLEKDKALALELLGREKGPETHGTQNP